MKTRLQPEDLVVSSFEVTTKGAVHAHEGTAATVCLCTHESDCYPSMYCSLDGAYKLTCAEGCMTNERGYC